MKQVWWTLSLIVCALTGSVAAATDFFCDDTPSCPAVICGGCVSWLDTGYNFGNTFQNAPRTFETGVGCMANVTHRVLDMWLTDCTYDDEWSGTVYNDLPFDMNKFDEVAVDIVFAPKVSLHGPGPRVATAVFCVQSLNDGSYSYCEMFLSGYARPGLISR